MKLNKFRILFIIFFFIVVIFLWLKPSLSDYYYYHYQDVENNLHPKEVYIPKRYSVIGVDVSRYQRRLNWKKLHAINHHSDTVNFSFVFAKATEGLSYKDPLYDYNKKESESHKGILFGAYHYFLPNKDPIKQADFFLKTANLHNENLLPVVDIEEKRGRSYGEIQESLLIFCKQIEKKLGVKPIIYSNKHFLLNILNDNFSENPLWVAHYKEYNLEMPDEYTWSIWQFTDKGSSFSTQSNIDLNLINGGTSTLNNLKIKNHL